MDFFFSLLKNKILLSILYPAFVLLLGWAGYSYVKIWTLESRAGELVKQNASLMSKLAAHETVSEDSLNAIKLIEQQCEERIKNATTQPKLAPSRDDDSDIDDLVQRLLNQANPRSKVSPPSARSGP